MSDNRETSLVTDALIAELVCTEQLLERYKSPDARLNDADHYGTAVLQLEGLVKAVLYSRASESLLVPETRGARFHSNSDTPVMRTVDWVIPYLHQDAANLMRDNGSALSKFKSGHTTGVVAKLCTLYDTILDDVRSVAANDLAKVAEHGVTYFMDAANQISKWTERRLPPARRAGSGRCDFMFVNGARCTKRADHNDYDDTDQHTPN